MSKIGKISISIPEKVKEKEKLNEQGESAKKRRTAPAKT